MFRRFVNAFRSATSPTAGRKFVEPMEPRQLLAAPPIVTNVVADNRGEVLITLDRFVRGVNKNSVRFFTAGADGVIGNEDDIRKTDISVSFNESNRRITVRGRTDVNAVFRLRLESNLITSSQDRRLDGEFTGTLPTGDGSEGGNFSFVARRDRTQTPIIRMSTSEGTVSIRMRKDVAPISATQFIDLANATAFDGMVFARAVPGFVLQAGSLQVTGDGNDASDVVGNTAATFPEELPRVLSNLRGTLSFARGGGLASNQFFFNVGDNDATSSFNNLDVADGPGDSVFTPFAEVTDGIAAVDAIVAKPTANLSSQIGAAAANGNVAVTDVPVNDPALAQAGLNPNRDLLVARRTAMRMKVGALV